MAEKRYGYTRQSDGDYGFHFRIHDSRDTRVATCPDEASAKEIVSALNAHNALVTACQAALASLMDPQRGQAVTLRLLREALKLPEVKP